MAPTYPLLWDTAIRSFKKVFPESLGGKWVGSPGRPADYSVDMQVKRGGIVEKIHLEVEFRSLSDKDIEEFVRGREVTAWWNPEMDQMDMELLSLEQNRVGRYPEPEDRPDDGGPPAYMGVFGDSNAPIIGSAFYKRFYLERAMRRLGGPGFEGKAGTDMVFEQPPGVLEDGSPNPNAENTHNLRRIRADYYPWLAGNMEEYDIGRLLRNKPGYSRHGKPVHPHFDRPRHVALKALNAERNLVLEIGADTGNTLKSAAVFTQRTWSGQRRYLAEISPVDRQIDLTEFAEEIRRVKDTRFPHVEHAVLYVDPAAATNTSQNRQISYAQLLQGACGIEVRLAPTNDVGMRRTALDQALKRSAGPGEPGVLIDPENCPQLIAALEGGYRFKKVGNVYSLTPEKNDHSHEAEAAQYVELSTHGLGVAGGGFIPPREVSADAERVILGD